MNTQVPHVTVIGAAEREVVPDEVVVVLEIVTPVLATPTEALSLGIEWRRIVRDLLTESAPDAIVSDARVTTMTEHEEVRERDVYGDQTARVEIRGHRGVCEVRARAAAGRAAALMALAGTQAAVTRARPEFVISRDLNRTSLRELEQDAVRDGLKRAEGLAAAAGLRPGGVISITPPGMSRGEIHEQDMVAFSPMAKAARIDMEEALGEIAPEPSLLSATVSVTIALRPS